MMHKLISEEFSNLSGLNRAYRTLRAEAMLELFGTTEHAARFAPECFQLQTEFNGNWVNHVQGLTESRDRVRMTSKAGGKNHRLVMQFSL